MTPMQERLAGVLVGAVVAAPVWIWVASGFFHAQVEGDPLAGSAVFSYPPLVLIITALVGLALIGAALRVGMDRQVWNFAFVGAGAGIFILGTAWFAAERIELQPDGFRYRSWWGLSSTTKKFADLAEVRIQQRDWRVWGRRWGLAIYYRTRAGEEGLLCDNTSRNSLWLHAGPHIIRLTRGAP
jgi:hypothetical protein